MDVEMKYKVGVLFLFTLKINCCIDGAVQYFLLNFFTKSLGSNTILMMHFNKKCYNYTINL